LQFLSLRHFSNHNNVLQLFEAPSDGKEVSLRYISALVQGATNVFWYDCSIKVNTISFFLKQGIFLVLILFSYCFLLTVGIAALFSFILSFEAATIL
jgi:hypothetical protein